jgi:hypothetical protein
MKDIKTLIVDIKNPEESKYVSPDKVGVFLLGRDISEYEVLLVVDGKFKSRVMFVGADIMRIQKVVNSFIYFLGLEEDE